MTEHTYLPPHPTVYEAEDGEQRVFPEDYGPVYKEMVWVWVPIPTPSAPRLQTVAPASKLWRRVERDPDDGPDQS